MHPLNISSSLRAELSWPNFLMLGIKFRALCILGKFCATEPHSQSSAVTSALEGKSAIWAP